MVREHRALALILVAFVILAAVYSIATPILEAGDEVWHYPFVQHLATGHSLPVQDPNVKTAWEQEGGQPPLYYALAALATFWIDTRDLPDRLWYNPEARIGIPLDYGNKNLIVHTSAEDFPWHNTALAVHLIRFLSILLSAGTVALTYFLALEISGKFVIASDPRSGERSNPQSATGGLLRHFAPRNDKVLAAVAAALVAFNPMFVFISASVNNDNLATLLATTALLLFARLLTRGATMRRFVVLGVVLGLAALSKVSDLGLLVVAAVVFIYLLWNQRAQVRERGSKILPFSLSPALLLACFVCAALVVGIAGWWYARNWLLYGDPLAFNVWVQISGGRPVPATVASLFAEFQGFRISFWGNFGGVNIIAPAWVYMVLDAFTLLAAIGLVIGLLRRALPRLLLLPLCWLALIAVLLVRWTLLTLASQGRLIFPAISAVAVLMAFGLAQFQVSSFRFRASRITFYALRFTSYFLRFSPVAFLFGFAVLAPLALIAPTYALPPRFADEALVPNLTHIVFDHQAELVGYALPYKAVAPGDELPLTLYWRALEPLGEDFSVAVRVFDAQGSIISKWNAFPGKGMYPTRLWQTGEIIADEYRVPIAPDARGPGVGRIDVGLFRRVPLEDLTARDPRGNIITPTIARLKVVGTSAVEIQNPVSFEFADQIALVGYAVENDKSMLKLRLFWRARATMEEDYTVFVHLVDASGNTVAQADSQPQRGAYPTSFWNVGETVADDYAVAIARDVPPGDYQVVVGVYRARDNTRLWVQSGGALVGGDQVVLATLPIGR